jgi:hypothetical protein
LIIKENLSLEVLLILACKVQPKFHLNGRLSKDNLKGGKKSFEVISPDSYRIGIGSMLSIQKR